MSYKILSKSSYLAGLQCSKLLWVKINDKSRLPDIDESKQKIFDTGHLIGNLAKENWDNGIDIDDKNFAENLKETKRLIEKRVPLFEPAFSIEKLYSRADILSPNTDGSWDIYEVKSGTKVKEVNIHDVSFQKHVYEKAGLKINKCFLMHINNQYIKDGEIDPKELFEATDITDKVEEFSEGIESRIAKMFEVINAEEPTVTIGCYCNEPYDCDLRKECWQLDDGNVFELYRTKQKAFDYFNEGIVKLANLPEEELSAKHIIQRTAEITKQPHINKKGITTFLDEIKYPIYYLDFETFNPAIPLFDGMKPYQRIPFQYSLHIQEEKDGELKHVSFLHKTTADPRKDFMQSLKDNLGSIGTILVYNQSFEIGVMRESSAAYPEFQEWFEQIKPRIKDLLIPFRNFDYYSHKQKGSCSIKYVLPVFSDLDYRNLDINNGMQASIEYESTVTGNLTEEEKQNIFDNLEKYCEQDTIAEVKIIDGLYETIKN